METNPLLQTVVQGPGTQLESPRPVSPDRSVLENHAGLAQNFSMPHPLRYCYHLLTQEVSKLTLHQNPLESFLNTHPARPLLLSMMAQLV